MMTYSYVTLGPCAPPQDNTGLISATCSVSGTTVSATYVRRAVTTKGTTINAVGTTSVTYAIGYDWGVFDGHEIANVSESADSWMGACLSWY